MRCKESVPIDNFSAPRPSTFLGSTYVRHCGIQPSFTLTRWADAGRAGTSGSDRRAWRRRRRLRLPRPGRHVRDGGEAAHARLAAPRTSVRAGRREPAARPRARLHEGPSVDLRQQPPGAARRRWSGSTTGSSSNDDELLAPHSCARAEPRMTVDSEAIFAIAAHSPERPARARAPARSHGDLLGRRARAWCRVRRPRQRPPALGRRGPRRRLLRLHEGLRSRSSSATARSSCASASCARARGSRSRTGGSPAARASGPTSPTTRTTHFPSVRAPQEREFCLTRLAALAAALGRQRHPAHRVTRTEVGDAGVLERAADEVRRWAANVRTCATIPP